MITKRVVLKTILSAGAVTAFTAVVPGLATVAAQTQRVRRSVNSMSLDDPDLSTYRDFVGLMRNIPATQAVSWVGFSSVHGSEKGYKYCPHGDWYFLPWHRAYVDMYEKAAASLLKNPQFAMPYWDWTTLRQLPAAFTDTTYKGQPNPLYVPGKGDQSSVKRRALTGAYALTDAIVGPAVMDSIYRETAYEAFGTSRNPQQTDLNPKWVTAGGGNQGILESSPHNMVHNNIGGYMPQPMSPRDPIFMMHHSNIDRIWATWSALGRTNSTDPLWLNMPFANNYIAPDGTLYTKVVKDLQSTAALGYTYDTLPANDNLAVDTARNDNLLSLFNAAPSATSTAKPQRFKQLNTLAATATKSLNVGIDLGVNTLKSVNTPLTEGPAKPREVVALISNIQISDNVLAIRVFVNRPTVDQNVPDSDPHFVRTLGFLRHSAGGDHSAHHKALPSALVNLTATLQKLSKEGLLSGDKVTLQLLAVPEQGVPLQSVGKVVPASIEIALI